MSLGDPPPYNNLSYSWNYDDFVKERDKVLMLQNQIDCLKFGKAELEDKVNKLKHDKAELEIECQYWKTRWVGEVDALKNEIANKEKVMNLSCSEEYPKALKIVCAYMVEHGYKLLKLLKDDGSEAGYNFALYDYEKKYNDLVNKSENLLLIDRRLKQLATAVRELSNNLCDDDVKESV
jgi:hypothetical protein